MAAALEGRGAPRHPPAVVVGVDCITGLQTARILAARGVPVVGTAAEPKHFACRARAVAAVVRSAAGDDSLLAALDRLAPELGDVAVLVPCTDGGVMAISKNRHRLAPVYRFALPAHSTVELLMDKTKFYRHARERALPVPESRLVTSRDDARATAAELAFPVIVKPALKTELWERSGLPKVFRIADARALQGLYDDVASFAGSLLVQEWVSGPDSNLYSCNCYFDRDGRPVVTFVARKLRQWRPEAGTSALGEECRNDEVLKTTLTLFGDLGFHGLGYLEMKRDERTGRELIIEPNVGRPTGRSPIAEAGGVELHYAMYCDIAGLALPDSLSQRYVGAKWIYLRHDIQSALYYLRRRRLSVRGWWRSVRGPKAYAVFSWSDPVPFVLDLWQTLIKVLFGKGPAP